MTSVTASVHIESAPDRVWAIFTDLASAPQRIQGIQSVEVLTPGPMGVGTRWRETRVMFGKEATEEMWVTSFNPVQSYEVAAESCGTEYHSAFTFTPEGTGTRVEMTFSGRPKTLASKLMVPLGWLMKGSIRKMLQQDLDNLKVAAEAGEVGTSESPSTDHPADAGTASA